MIKHLSLGRFPSIAAPAAVVREQTEAAESPQLFPVLSQLQIFFENTAEAGVELVL
jgi:hypothetical protein